MNQEMTVQVDKDGDLDVYMGGSRRVRVHGEGRVYAWLFVNARKGFADATMCRGEWSGLTRAGALRWAKKRLQEERKCAQ